MWEWDGAPRPDQDAGRGVRVPLTTPGPPELQNHQGTPWQNCEKKASRRSPAPRCGPPARDTHPPRHPLGSCIRALLARHARRESDTSRAERPGGSRVACSSARAAGGRRALACRGAVAAAGHGLPDAGTNGRAARPSTSVAAGPLTAYDMPVGVLADGFSATPRGRDRVAGLDYEDVSRASGSVEQLSLRGGAPILAESKESVRRCHSRRLCVL